MNKKGFTLIELLVVIAVIAVLATLFLNTSTVNIKRARDAKRKSDTAQYQNALEIYATKNNSAYPSRTTGSDRSSTILCTDLGLTNCAEDQQYATDPTLVYLYESDGTGSGSMSGSKYVLWSKLESTTDYWVLCSNGLSGIKPQGSFSVTGGICPLP